MFDNLCKSWPRGSQQCINRPKNKQTSYRVLNTVLIKVLYERYGSWPQKCYGDGYSTGWLRHFIATRRYEFFNFRSAEARSAGGWWWSCPKDISTQKLSQSLSYYLFFSFRKRTHQAFSERKTELWISLVFKAFWEFTWYKKFIIWSTEAEATCSS